MPSSHLPITDHLILSTHVTRRDLQQVPLVLLKRLLVEFLGRKNNHSNNSELAIVVPSTASHTPLELVITSASFTQNVRVLFESDKEDTKEDVGLAFSLQLCAHCGASVECCCGWRQQHTIPPDMETHDIAHFIATKLVDVEF